MALTDLLASVQQFETWVNQHPAWPLYAGGASVAAGGLGLGIRAAMRTLGLPAGEDTSHGSARWAMVREVRKAGFLTRHGLPLGHLGRWVIRSDGEAHLLNCGPTSSGKDRKGHFWVTMEYPHSMLITDIKDGGENYQACSHWRKHRGPVYWFAPRMRTSCCCNLLDTLRVGQPEEWGDAGVLAQSHLAPLKKGYQAHGSASFFQNQAVPTLQALMLHTAQQPQGRRPHALSTTLRLFGRSTETLAEMASSPCQPIRERTAELQAMQRQSSEQFQGVWDQAATALSIYRDPLVAGHTNRSDFRLTDLQYGSQPMTLYLGARTQTEVGTYLYPLYRSVLEMAVHQLTDRQPTLEHPRRPLLSLFNEFAEFGYMAVLEKAPATVRSSLIRILISLQDVGQLWSHYGHDTPIWSNCTVKVFHRPEHDETAALLANRLGEETISVTSESRQGWHPRKTRTTHASGRALLTKDELLGLDPQHDLIIWASGCSKPIRATKLRAYGAREEQGGA